MIRVYGISNCDTVRKARKWLDQRGIEYQFHDFKKLGLARTTLLDWIDKAGWETLLNRRGMMWRKLPQDVRDSINQDGATAIMLRTPTIIKRPVLETGGSIHVGFSERLYSRLLG